ncbi:methyltransferase [Bordetella genomosp. 8]|uniref:Putative 4-hydroxy-4-methyl-2-oxoglutarate aldolase n=1 Tax=Bordetella genomosp. 8 TaxID=1416806 RepID=A0A1W6YGB0_9BORD|nr:RraA family protein [Bordetella genomosp. 8]ARP79573.1 methyltransferase [Bordetella genomosp. 8]
MIGFEIHTRQRAVSAQTVADFRGLPVANVSDVMSRMTAGGPTLRPMHDGTYMAGPALTVRCRPGDNLLVHKALDLAKPGDVVVVDAGGDLTNAIIGEIMVAYATRRQLAGIVIHGAIRDSATLQRGSFPVFAAGVTHRGPYKDGPGVINGPVSLAGMVIEPGDLVIGDEDGLLCVPYGQVDEVLAATREKHHVEEKMMADIAADRLDTSWIDARLKTLGCMGV